MNTIKRIFYPIRTIIVPFVILILLSLFISSVLTIVDYNGNWFFIDLSKVPFINSKIVVFIIVFVLILTKFRSLNSKKEFAPTDIYGDYHVLVYYVAWLFAGYRKINLKMKPIPLQFQLLNLNRLECFDDSECLDLKYAYKVIYSGKKCKNNMGINIIISDTYRLYDDMIPSSLRNNYTVHIIRDGEYGVRTKSQELIYLLIKEVQKFKCSSKVYNLFLSTPGFTNKSIYNQVFHTGRDEFILYIYQQDNKNNFIFKDKPIIIKC